VLLSIPTGVQVAGLEAWIHISRVKHWNTSKTLLPKTQMSCSTPVSL
jgi:hypothetical protein